jgi:cupin superfamily acireductone dioxygenase involved in methionine salvage
MVLPAGCEGPLHLHTDAEEIFFILRGERVRIMVEHKGELVETILKERDLISVPPGVYRGEINIGEEEALMCVMLGSPRPITPTYPPDHPLAAIKRPTK